MRDSRREVPKQINWVDFFLECFRNRKNISIYTSFGRDRPMALINGYDGTVHRNHFKNVAAILSVMKPLDEAR